MGYDKSNDRVRTPKVDAIFGSILILFKEISNIKKENQFLLINSPTA